MIWTVRVECIWGIYLEEKCIRVIEIDSGCSLLDLHGAIQDAVGFDNDHMFEFLIGRNWRRGRSLDDGCFPEDMADRYDSIKFGDVFPPPKGQKLFYHFDFGDDWYFVVKNSRKKPRDPEPNVTYPRLVDSIGPNPPQYGRYEDEEDDEEESEY